MPRALTNALPKWLAFAVGLWAAQAALAVEDHLLLGGRAVTMSDPVNTFRFYYEIPNGITVDWQKVDLFWDSSPTIRPESSSITVLLNGQTLASNRLRPAANSGAQ
ncbi:MAG: cellulose biosynthesis cyclic di-GMP-binding regulatory protein BcsB, partial [Nitrospirae bacterium]|nr:cellulose biosynthesis cyclic di-GMP-binding regulatory protein BcsB [Fimbriimonadaceae bacterium]